MQQDQSTSGFPRIDPLGPCGLLVRFSDTLSEPANRAALAFGRTLSQRAVPGVSETATSLVSVQIRFDPARLNHERLREILRQTLAGQDWSRATLPTDRRIWRIPTVYGGVHGPQLAEAAAQAGVTEKDAVALLSAAQLRVLAIGFAPGQPYVGRLPEEWNLPRQTSLNTRVPPGALALAVRQFVLFPAETQTGWYHVGQTAFRCFRPDTTPAFPLKPGDEMVFPAVSDDEFEALRHRDSGNGGATCEVLA